MDLGLRRFRTSLGGADELTAAMFYNDQQPDKIFYQGLTYSKLGEKNKAHSCFHKLIDYGEQHLFDEVIIDYFAVSLPDMLVFDDDLNQRHRMHCHYLTGLGYLGLQRFEQAQQVFQHVLSMDINHQGAQVHLNMIDRAFPLMSGKEEWL